MTFLDKRLICRYCQKEFLFSAGEQEFYAQKSLLNEPKRCPNCRIKLKAQSLGREAQDVTCADCGVPTIVPFKPTRQIPVFCHDCLRKVRDPALVESKLQDENGSSIT